MARARKRALKKNYVQVPNETATAVEVKTEQKSISLQALGLIVNLWSYDVDEWELHKTELYKRYEKNKETSVRNAWKELIEANYIVEYKYRVGKKYEYMYEYRIEPFTEEEVKEIYEEAVEEFGEIWGLDFQDSKNGDLIFKTSKCGPQNQEISNNTLTKDLINEIEEEEEETVHSELVNHLVSKGHKLEDAIDLENRMIELKITNYEFIDVEKAIEWSKKQEHVDVPYIYAAKRVIREVDFRTMPKEEPTKQPKKSYGPKKQGRSENVPKWFYKRNKPNNETAPALETVPAEEPTTDFEAERQKILQKLKG